ncbi:hypothetical protein HDU76_009103, partial [Blyttiomyces sp. JEL0837]
MLSAGRFSTSSRKGNGTQKAKKSVNALVLVSTAPASIALPQIFHTLSTLRPRAQSDAQLWKARGRGAAGSTKNAGTDHAELARAQSLSVLPQSNQEAALRSSQPLGVIPRFGGRTLGTPTSASNARGEGAGEHVAGVRGELSTKRMPAEIPQSNNNIRKPSEVKQNEPDEIEEDWDAELGLDSAEALSTAQRPSLT